MTNRHALCAAVLLAAWSIEAAASGGTIVDGPASFVRTASSFDATPEAHLTGVSPLLTQDHLVEAGWWFRVAGDPAETPFPTPTAEAYAFDTSAFTWTAITSSGGQTFGALEVAVVTDTDTDTLDHPSGYVKMTLTILAGPTALPICIFHMADFDLQPGSGDDDAALLYRPNHIRITDRHGVNAAEYRGVGARAYLVRPRGTSVPSVGDVLNDASITDFGNSGLPLSNANVTAGFQWCTTVPAGGQHSFTAVLTLDRSLVRGDFNDDARTDLLLRDSSLTDHLVWPMASLTQISAPGALPVTPSQLPTRLAVCTEDFNGDLRTDILFHEPGQPLEIWVMGGPNGVVRQAVLPVTGSTPLVPAWAVSGCADLNHDGEVDVLWQNTATGKLLAWLLNDNVYIGQCVPSPDQAPPNWNLVALLDFDGDGNIDYLWYNTTSGNLVFWFMDANCTRICASFASPMNAGSLNWKVVGAGEFGQGNLALPPIGAGDILWQNTASHRVVGWIMDAGSGVACANARLEGLLACPTGVGAAVGAGCDPASPFPLDWSVVGPR